jgi:phosphonate transport system substrate-binding protein
MKPYFITLLLAFIINATFSQQEKINFYLAPSLSQDLIAKKGQYIKEFIEKETGLSIQLVVPSSYDEMVNHFANTKPCFAFMSSQSYILAAQKFGATVKLRTVRFGHSVYYGMILTRTSSGVKDIQDLQGKTIAYTDVLSTSGYLYPKKLLEKNKVKPGKEIFAKTHDEVVKMVYEGKADAGAAFYSPPSSDGVIRDARVKVKDKYPDIQTKLNPIVVTDPIPNDPIVFSKNFHPDAVKKITVALMKLSSDAKGKQTLQDIYGTEGFVKASDADYNSLRLVMGVPKS